ncbi:MAG: YkgJ family cysteine cluster protein [Chitinispirillia bacterium]|jgi:Fe-S-cluster containining protein
MTDNFFLQLEKLYSELPELSCKECGLCCVSPTCTLSEFIYLFKYLCENYPGHTVKEYVLTPLEIHPSYEGNLRCIFLKNGRCIIHAARTGACRLFGMPNLHKFEINDLEECRNNITVISGNSDITFIKAWLDKLVALNESLYHFSEEPYFIRGFNIQCWLDIYFDDSLDFDVFNEIKVVMYRYIDLSYCKKSYSQQTGIRDKFDKIAVLSSLLSSSSDIELVRKTVYSVKNDYHTTGTYYLEEAEAYLSAMEKIDNKK